MNVTTRFEEIAGIRSFVAGPDRAAPAIVFYSDIFQLTPPHLRLATRFAQRGYLVVAPEIYRGIEPPGVVLDFDRDRQRALDDSARVRVEDADADRDAILGHLAARADVSRIFAAGNCFGGHLAFRAAYDARVSAVSCFYPTTVHADRLGASENVDTLRRAADLRAKLLLVWGARDPHIPADGRSRIERALADAGAAFETRTFDAEHAFMRDEGPRFDPAATEAAIEAMFAFFEG